MMQRNLQLVYTKSKNHCILSGEVRTVVWFIGYNCLSYIQLFKFD